MIKTSNNQRLESAFDDLDPRLSLLPSQGEDSPPVKSRGDARYAAQDPFDYCPIQSRLQSVLGVRSFYVKRNYKFVSSFTSR